jgi:hypothetical protein
MIKIYFRFFFLVFVISGILVPPLRAAETVGVERPPVAFLEMGMLGLSNWKHVSGTPGVKLDLGTGWRSYALKLGNEVIKGQLVLPLDKGFRLTFKGGLSEAQRLLRVALMDDQGRVGYSILYGTGNLQEGEAETENLTLAAFVENESDHEPEWSDRHNLKKSLIKKNLELKTNEPHVFVLSYDPENSQAELSVNGDFVGKSIVDADKIKKISAIYIWGNVWSYVGDIVVLSGPPAD